MRTPVVTALVILGLGLVGCSDDPDSGTDAEPPVSTSVTSPTSAPSASPTTGSDPAACEEVVAGIDAFNAGDLEATVEHFELAVPLARAQAESAPSEEADALLEAVRYYAELPAEDYPDAAAGSPDFAKYKAITLDQCVGPPASPGLPSSSGVTI